MTKAGPSSTLRRFAGFAMVGGVGFLVDAGVLSLSLSALGPFLGRIVSFSIAVCTTFALNAWLVFEHDGTLEGLMKQFAKYILANGVGFLVNLTVYTSLIALNKAPPINPLIALAIASIIALAVNFTLTNVFVFRVKPKSKP